MLIGGNLFSIVDNNGSYIALVFSKGLKDPVIFFQAAFLNVP
jgi:hypothetical protein